jgi:hypothetical protein
LYNQEYFSHFFEKETIPEIKVCKVDRYLQKPDRDILKTLNVILNDQDGSPNNHQCMIDTGVVVFLGESFRAICRLSNDPYLNETFNKSNTARINCSRFELYSDLLFACRTNKVSSIEEYYHLCSVNKPSELHQKLFDAFTHQQLYMICFSDGSFSHLGTSDELMSLFMSDSNRFYYPENLIASRATETGANIKLINSFSMINSIPNSISLIADSSLLSPNLFFIEDKNYTYAHLISNLYFTVSSQLCLTRDLMVQQVEILSPGSKRPNNVLVILSIKDQTKIHYNDPVSTICGYSWDDFFQVSALLFSQ